MTPGEVNLDAADSTVQSLSEIARRFGTPTYAFDITRMRRQAKTLLETIPSEVDVLYSLKANASLGVCEVFRECQLGADVASAGELATAIAAGFASDRIFVAGPFKTEETISQLHDRPEAVISIDSPSDLYSVSRSGLRNPLVLRLRPDFGSCAVVAAGSESRFGFTDDDLLRLRYHQTLKNVNLVGFHVFAGSQVLDAEAVNNHLSRSLELTLRAAETLEFEPKLLNLGGGFGIPYASTDADLDLRSVGDQLANMVRRAGPARIVLELGRYLIAEAGWYLTTVLGHQVFQQRPAVIVDGGTHQRADMCGLCLRTKADAPIVLNGDSDLVVETDVLGNLSLPADVMAEASLLPELAPGDVLAFANAGAYGVWSSPALFHGSPLPAEVAFDESSIYPMRERRAANSILDDQMHLDRKTTPALS